jgi:rfaE bifunctional protein kinase chain/domain
MDWVERILSGFPNKRALVAGDICLDRWCHYDPACSDVSRETGIPRIGVVATQTTAGAGGTIANNLAALRAGAVAVLGIIGEDGNGYELRRALDSRGISHGLCVNHAEVSTFTYTKLINVETGAEDLPRVDFINNKPLPQAAEKQVLDRLRNSVPSFDVILISDQAETSAGGVITPAVRAELASLAFLYPNKVYWVDSRMRCEHFRGMILKPNEEEARTASERCFGSVDFDRLRKLTASPLLVITHGRRGALLVGQEGETWVNAAPVENPVDICGAGDAFSAGAAVAYAITRDPVAAARFGNLAASVTIMKKGTGTAAPEELRAAASRPRS